MSDSTDKVIVIVKLVAEAITCLLEALVGDHNVGVWWLFNLGTVLHHCKVLEGVNRACRRILLTIVERIVFLGDLKCEQREPNGESDEANAYHKVEHRRAQLLPMHAFNWISHHPVKILVDVANQVTCLVLKIVPIDIVVMNKRAAVHMLWTEIKSNVVPVHRQHFLVIEVNMRESLGHWDWKMYCF